MIEQYFTGLPVYVQIFIYLVVGFLSVVIGYTALLLSIPNFQNKANPNSEGAIELGAPPSEDIRYQQRKVSRKGKDVNRFGRWSLRLYNKKVITKVGYLYKVLADTSSVKTYREIK